MSSTKKIIGGIAAVSVASHALLIGSAEARSMLQRQDRSQELQNRSASRGKTPQTAQTAQTALQNRSAPRKTNRKEQTNHENLQDGKPMKNNFFRNGDGVGEQEHVMELQKKNLKKKIGPLERSVLDVEKSIENGIDEYDDVSKLVKLKSDKNIKKLVKTKAQLLSNFMKKGGAGSVANIAKNNTGNIGPILGVTPERGLKKIKLRGIDHSEEAVGRFGNSEGRVGKLGNSEGRVAENKRVIRKISAAPRKAKVVGPSEQEVENSSQRVDYSSQQVDSSERVTESLKSKHYMHIPLVKQTTDRTNSLGKASLGKSGKSNLRTTVTTTKRKQERQEKQELILAKTEKLENEKGRKQVLNDVRKERDDTAVPLEIQGLISQVTDVEAPQILPRFGAKLNLKLNENVRNFNENMVMPPHSTKNGPQKAQTGSHSGTQSGTQVKQVKLQPPSTKSSQLSFMTKGTSLGKISKTRVTVVHKKLQENQLGKAGNQRGKASLGHNHKSETAIGVTEQLQQNPMDQVYQTTNGTNENRKTDETTDKNTKSKENSSSLRDSSLKDSLELPSKKSGESLMNRGTNFTNDVTEFAQHEQIPARTDIFEPTAIFEPEIIRQAETNVIHPPQIIQPASTFKSKIKLELDDKLEDKTEDKLEKLNPGGGPVKKSTSQNLPKFLSRNEQMRLRAEKTNKTKNIKETRANSTENKGPLKATVPMMLAPDMMGEMQKLMGNLSVSDVKGKVNGKKTDGNRKHEKFENLKVLNSLKSQIQSLKQKFNSQEELISFPENKSESSHSRRLSKAQIEFLNSDFQKIQLWLKCSDAKSILRNHTRFTAPKMQRNGQWRMGEPYDLKTDLYKEDNEIYNEIYNEVMVKEEDNVKEFLTKKSAPEKKQEEYLERLIVKYQKLNEEKELYRRKVVMARKIAEYFLAASNASMQRGPQGQQSSKLYRHFSINLMHASGCDSSAYVCGACLSNLGNLGQSQIKDLQLVIENPKQNAPLFSQESHQRMFSDFKEAGQKSMINIGTFVAFELAHDYLKSGDERPFNHAVFAPGMPLSPLGEGGDAKRNPLVHTFKNFLQLRKLFWGKLFQGVEGDVDAGWRILNDTMYEGMSTLSTGMSAQNHESNQLNPEFGNGKSGKSGNSPDYIDYQFSGDHGVMKIDRLKTEIREVEEMKFQVEKLKMEEVDNGDGDVKMQAEIEIEKDSLDGSEDMNMESLIAQLRVILPEINPLQNGSLGSGITLSKLNALLSEKKTQLSALENQFKLEKERMRRQCLNRKFQGEPAKVRAFAVETGELTAVQENGAKVQDKKLDSILGRRRLMDLEARENQRLMLEAQKWLVHDMMLEQEQS